MCPAPAPPPSPLERAARALATVLPSARLARRWFDACVAAWGCARGGGLRGPGCRPRDAPGGDGGDDLPRRADPELDPVGAAGRRGSEEREDLEIQDGRQRIALVYAADGRRVETCLDDRFPGRCGSLRR